MEMENYIKFYENFFYKLIRKCIFNCVYSFLISSSSDPTKTHSNALPHTQHWLVHKPFHLRSLLLLAQPHLLPTLHPHCPPYQRVLSFPRTHFQPKSSLDPRAQQIREAVIRGEEDNAGRVHRRKCSEFGRFKCKMMRRNAPGIHADPCTFASSPPVFVRLQMLPMGCNSVGSVFADGRGIECRHGTFHNDALQ